MRCRITFAFLLICAAHLPTWAQQSNDGIETSYVTVQGPDQVVEEKPQVIVEERPEVREETQVVNVPEYVDSTQYITDSAGQRIPHVVGRQVGSLSPLYRPHVATRPQIVGGHPGYFRPQYRPHVVTRPVISGGHPGFFRPQYRPHATVGRVYGHVRSFPHGDFGHLGCFRDRAQRDLPRLVHSGANSVQLCRAACQRLGYRFAGVQWSRECWCGNSYGRYGRASNCNMRCTANNGQICGGGWANNVYTAIGHASPPRPPHYRLPIQDKKMRYSHRPSSGYGAGHALGLVGCFRDKAQRDLPRLAYSGSNSVEQCKAACKRLGFRFAGVQWARECWCGHGYGRYGPANNCNMRCTANNGQTCGGDWANNVYVTFERAQPPRRHFRPFQDRKMRYPSHWIKRGPDHNGHLGCFRDKAQRDLPRLAYSGSNSVELCRAACQRLGFSYAGVQWSKECWCGNSYGKYGNANNCNKKCSANIAQTCGGDWANNVYTVIRHAPPPKPHWTRPAHQNLEHLGCFRDKARRDLPRLAYSGNNNVQLCKSACQRLGYRFAGVQWSKECWCGNSYGRYGGANNCNKKCSANIAQTCGGDWANNVYRASP